MDFQFPASRILVFAREPLQGQVKTRLEPALGARRTLALYRQLLRKTVSTVIASRLSPMELWVSSNPHHKEFLSLCNKSSIYEQNGTDLGARMAHAIASSLPRTGVSSVIVIGTDCPLLDASYLRQALEKLEQGAEAVFGPAEDGGYVLLACRRLIPGLFKDMPWGSDCVLSTSRARLDAEAINYALLDSRWDVDRPEDLPALAGLVPPIIY